MHPQNVAETWPFHRLDWRQKQILADSFVALWHLPCPLVLSGIWVSVQYISIPFQQQQNTHTHTPICSKKKYAFSPANHVFSCRCKNSLRMEFHCFTNALLSPNCHLLHCCEFDTIMRRMLQQNSFAQWASLRWPCDWPVWHVVLNSRVYHLLRFHLMAIWF